MSSESAKRVHNLIKQVQAELVKRDPKDPEVREGVEDCVARLAGLELSAEKLTLDLPAMPNHSEGLKQAITSISHPSLQELKNAISAAEGDISWREDDGVYYKDQANLGNYVGNNLHCQLIGPGGVAYQTDQVMMGLFYLAPRVLYRDHQHPAPELYFTLSNRSGWRFGTDNQWQDYAADSLIWNAPLEVHATRVYDEPFFAVFVWTKDIPAPPVILNPDAALLDDWAKVERELEA